MYATQMATNRSVQPYKCYSMACYRLQAHCHVIYACMASLTILAYHGFIWNSTEVYYQPAGMKPGNIRTCTGVHYTNACTYSVSTDHGVFPFGQSPLSRSLGNVVVRLFEYALWYMPTENLLKIRSQKGDYFNI